MPSKDRIKNESNRNYAIWFLRDFANKSLKNYVEPKRTRVRKGNSIGFSASKLRTAYFMILYPASRLNEIGDLSNVPHGSLHVWATQKDFLDEVQKIRDLISEGIINTIEFDLMKKYFSTSAVEPSFKRKPRFEVDLKAIYKNPNEGSHTMFFINILPFLGINIAVKVLKWLSSRLRDHAGALSLEYTKIALRIIDSVYIQRGEDLKKWLSRPEMINLDKAHFEHLINSLIDPETLKQPREKIEDLAKILKGTIFKRLDALSS